MLPQMIEDIHSPSPFHTLELGRHPLIMSEVSSWGSL